MILSIVVGIDIGGSTTKIAGFKNGTVINPMLVRASDPVASAYGAFGRFLSINGLSLSDVNKVMVTGVGSSFISAPLFGLETQKVDEFKCIGMGGLFLSKLEKCIVISMGTGTALVLAYDNTTRHLGGTGIGGGTLLGLSKLLLKIHNYQDLVKTAEGGNLSNIDLSIGDITKDLIPGLPPEATASNFGKISDLASREDIAMGIINMVFQTIGKVAIFAARAEGVKDMVLTGNLTKIPQSQEVFDRLGRMFGVKFHKPYYAEYCTAIGAAISYEHHVNTKS